jgi:hypothetical protein
MSYHKPAIYDHDCEACTYLGSLIRETESIDVQDRENEDGKEIYDLYICLNPRNKNLSSLIARYSSVDSEYMSCPVDIFLYNLGTINPLSPTREVYVRAVEDGLLTEDNSNDTNY